MLGGLLFFFLQTSLYAATESCKQQQCVVIVDAGSTGSRIHLYSYDTDNNHSPIRITERWSKKINPGIASIKATKPSVDAYLRRLFIDAPIRHLPVYFFATAGMRLLPQPKQQQLHTLVQTWFSDHSDWTLVRSKTITGADEGLYGWLAVNYQLGALTHNKQSIGMMDMGGASVQVVFPVKNAEGAAKNDIYPINLYGKRFNLFIHSFLGLGQTEVAHQFMDSKACFITNYELPTGEPAEGDAYVCESDVASLMNQVHHVDQVVQPLMSSNPVNQWYVMGGLVDLAKKSPFNTQELTNQNLLDKANGEICHEQWSTLKTQYPNDDYVYGYCLFPAYYYALMVEGYGIQPQETLHYLGENQANDWTMGVVLYPQG